MQSVLGVKAVHVLLLCARGAKNTLRTTDGAQLLRGGSMGIAKKK